MVVLNLELVLVSVCVRVCISVRVGLCWLLYELALICSLCESRLVSVTWPGLVHSFIVVVSGALFDLYSVVPCSLVCLYGLAHSFVCGCVMCALPLSGRSRMLARALVVGVIVHSVGFCDHWRRLRARILLGSTALRASLHVGAVCALVGCALCVRFVFVSWRRLCACPLNVFSYSFCLCPLAPSVRLSVARVSAFVVLS